MIKLPKTYDPGAAVLVVAIGNSSIRLAKWHGQKITQSVDAPTGEADAFESALRAQIDAFGDAPPAASVIASVVPGALKRVRADLSRVLGRDPLVIGEKIGPPITADVDQPASVGMDRLCCAAAALERLAHGCVIVDFGTAVTVDLVTDEGVFVGGAILPGLRLQLGALAGEAALLPEVEPAFPENVVGINTEQAMQIGVCRGIVGAVRGLVEAYASKLNRWLQVVATGGDAVFMAPHCDFLDNVVPDLQLRGVGLAYSRYLVSMGA